MSGPFELIGDPDAAVCDGDFCALPTDVRSEPQDADPQENDERGSERYAPPA